MVTRKINRNENAPFYFEILLAGIEFLNLLERDSIIEKIQVKPDRKYGEDRRIEDLTKFYKNGQVEVVQIKHTLRPGSRLGFGELWIAHPSQSTVNQASRGEGTNIFKFLKSWRIHKKQNKSILLTIKSNKSPTKGLDTFLNDIKKLREKKLRWKSFCKRHPSEIQSIESNCNRKPFVNQKELNNFLLSLRFQKVPNIDPLEEILGIKLKRQGIVDGEGLNAFINRITKTFISNQIEVIPQRVNELINRLKTGLIQEIAAPTNYIERPDLESKILCAIEAKKKEGGFVLLFAPSGSGKTVLLSKLAEKNADFFPYFCRIRPLEVVRGKSGYSNINRLNSSWFKADIIQRCHEFGLLDTTVGINNDEKYIDKTFDDAVKKLSEKALSRPGKKIVIIVDALDQVQTDKYRSKSVLDAIPSNNYPGIVFLLSTWGEKYLPQSIKNLPKNTKNKIGINLYFTEDEIKKYFQQVSISLTQDQVTVIKNKTAGLAISLFYLSKKLKQQSTRDNIIHSSSHYTEVFDWYRPIWSSLNIKEKECLGYLCFHFARVKREDLQQIVRARLNIAAFNELLKTIDHFLNIGGGFIDPYHDSFRRFVVAQLKGDKNLYHQRLAKYYFQNKLSPYSKKYITKHLEVVGIKDSSAKGIFKKLHQAGFFEKVLGSNLDDPTKVEIGKSFVSYFYFTKNVEQLVRYSIVTSNVYPTTYGEDVFKKAQIGTDKLVAEIEDELFLPRGSQSWDQREWVFKRLTIGNILVEKKNKNCLNLAHRFIEDSLFRISLNRSLLWGEEAKNDFWHNVDGLTYALVYANRYKSALFFLRRRIAFQNPIPSSVGFRCIKLAKVHVLNLKINSGETLKTLSRSSKMERLLAYLWMYKDGLSVSNKEDFKKLLRDETIERFLYDDKYESQRLDLAESLFIQGIKSGKIRIQRLLNKVEIELPYWSHGHIYWGYPGNPRKIFLRWVALKILTDKSFDLRDFYTKTLERKFVNAHNRSEYENPEFLNILSVECNLAKNRLLSQTKRITWKNFWKSFEDSLKLYKQKIDQISINADPYSSERKTLYPYSHDLGDLIEDNLMFINARFPNKALFALKKIESNLSTTYIFDRANLLEVLIRASIPITPLVKERLDIYLRKALEIRRKEKLDNMSKSSNLQDLAVLAAHKGFAEIADDIFVQSVKYSRGLRSKEDLRFYNLIDCLRTQKQEEYELIMKYIERVSDVIEGAWHWWQEILESATYADYRMALAYLYKFMAEGKVDQNNALRTIISTYIKHYTYDTTENILPLLSLMQIKEETSYEYFENIEKTYHDLLALSLAAGDYQRAENLTTQYVGILKKDINPPDRINLLRDLLMLISPYSQLNSIRKDIESHMTFLQQEGYSATTKTNSEFRTTYDGSDIKRLKTTAKRGHIGAVLKSLSEFAKTKSYFIDELVTELIPFLSCSDIQRVREWAAENKITLDGHKLFSALVKKAVTANNQSLLVGTRSEIIRFINYSERSYEIPEIIKALDKLDFPNKRSFIRKILLMSIRKQAGSGYSLSLLFVHCSETIDKYFIDLKKYSYESWKNEVEKSMRLSLSK
jgi:hypothetical protein